MIRQQQCYQIGTDLCHIFFKQNFSQVTNPPIDSLRENEVMSLKTRFGNLGNILDFENLTKDNIYVLESPILSNSQFEKFTVFFKDSLKVLDCTFDVQTNLKKKIRPIVLRSRDCRSRGVQTFNFE